MKYLEVILTILFSGIALAIALYFIVFVIFIWHALTTAELDPDHEDEI